MYVPMYFNRTNFRIGMNDEKRLRDLHLKIVTTNIDFFFQYYISLLYCILSEPKHTPEQTLISGRVSHDGNPFIVFCSRMYVIGDSIQCRC